MRATALLLLLSSTAVMSQRLLGCRLSNGILYSEPQICTNAGGVVQSLINNGQLTNACCSRGSAGPAVIEARFITNCNNVQGSVGLNEILATSC